ncbi:MAG: hypothetical protein ACR2HY_09935, partial [Acidimicrobiales bacterium]
PKNGRSLHPIERLRMVARAQGEDPALVAREAAEVLADCAGDPAALVTGCRRLVDHQPTSGPIWWLAARVLSAADPEEEAWRSADLLAGDATPGALGYHLPEDTTVLVVGWPDQASEALRRRGDCRVLVVDDISTGGGLARWLRRAGSDALVVEHAGMGPAAAASGLVLLEATALGAAGDGEAGFVAAAGSRAAAAVARSAGVPVWVVAGVGRVLPGPLWQAMVGRLEAGTDPWDRPDEVVPLALADQVVGPGGPFPAAEAPARADCPSVPELTRTVAMPGSRPRGGAEPHHG